VKQRMTVSESKRIWEMKERGCKPKQIAAKLELPIERVRNHLSYGKQFKRDTVRQIMHNLVRDNPVPVETIASEASIQRDRAVSAYTVRAIAKLDKTLVVTADDFVAMIQ